jgi:hypothetical protein
MWLEASEWWIHARFQHWTAAEGVHCHLVRRGFPAGYSTSREEGLTRCRRGDEGRLRRSGVRYQSGRELSATEGGWGECWRMCNVLSPGREDGGDREAGGTGYATPLCYGVPGGVAAAAAEGAARRAVFEKDFDGPGDEVRVSTSLRVTEQFRAEHAVRRRGPACREVATGSGQQKTRLTGERGRQGDASSGRKRRDG